MSANTRTPAEAAVYTPPSGGETNVKAYLDALTGAIDDLTPPTLTEFAGVCDGVSATFSLPGVSATPAAYWRVVVGGALQPPSAYVLDTTAETITFDEVFPLGLEFFVLA